MSQALSRRALMANAIAMSGLASACSSSPDTPDATTSPSDALGELDGTGVAAAIRTGHITALEAMDAAIARAERVNPQLNFMASAFYDAGRARAGERLAGPFAGVPTLIKDLLPMVGQPTKYGSRAFANFVPTEQPPYMDALLAAGLAPFGKSTTPEFGLTATTEPLLGGATRNPWDPAKSCGGSSGGAAVAVAARVVPVAHASDGGGSIRIPASCNGLFGLKPSRDRTVSAGRPDSGISISVNGCVSRSVRDSAAWLAVTEQTGAGAALPPVGMVSSPNRQRLRIMLATRDFLGREPQPDVLAAIHGVAELCRSLGHEVREGRSMEGQQFADDFILIWAAGAAEVVQLVQSQAPEGAPLDQLLEPLTLELAQLAQTQGPEALQASLQRLLTVEATFNALLADVDVLLTPVLTSTPPAIGEFSPTLGMAGLERVNAYVGYTPLQNVAGAPAMSVPLAWSEANGMPIGAHFSAPKGHERKLLELAYELEQARPWASRRARVSAV
ncbi:MAG: amidase [Hyphomonadaceae bacterium]